MDDGKIFASFRDKNGIVFSRRSVLYRQINLEYKENYDFLLDSGLYNVLVGKKLLIPHAEADIGLAIADKAYKIIKPEPIPFISYPYEWCFSQLKEAALSTLKIQKIALGLGMSLKDCSAYNIQFRQCRPVLIDTLSFERYREASPWVAYRQFCQHFLAPLALMSYKDARLSQLLRIYIDGIPLDLASSLLPLHSRLKFSLLSHLHFHARSQIFFAHKDLARKNSEYGMSKFKLLALIDSLESAIKGLNWQCKDASWSDYYADTNYSHAAFDHKKQIIAELLKKAAPGSVWDLGANIGLFSRIAGEQGAQTISFDADHAAVEKNYLNCIRESNLNILPLVMDLTNPSPGLGWKNQERMSLLERSPADAVLALALIHHLTVANNLPFDMIANFFSDICNFLVIEFVPKNDSQVQKLLSIRQDIFSEYTQPCFEVEFKKYFTIQDRVKIRDSERVIYLMRRN